MDALPAPLQTELLLRFGLAALLGAVLGWDRQLGQHPAGLRVHVLVALGAAVYTVAGVYGVAGLGTVQDAGRVAAQVVVGVGFLGAGTIWRSRDDRVIYGLTTAASIWLAAGLGMLAAYGLYFLAVGGALLGVAVLWAMKPLERAALALPRPVLAALPRLRQRAARVGALEPAAPISGAGAPPAGTGLVGVPDGAPTEPGALGHPDAGREDGAGRAEAPAKRDAPPPEDGEAVEADRKRRRGRKQKRRRAAPEQPPGLALQPERLAA